MLICLYITDQYWFYPNNEQYRKHPWCVIMYHQKEMFQGTRHGGRVPMYPDLLTSRYLDHWNIPC